MGAQSRSSFGTFARETRLKKELGLRKAARLMSVSAAYLSRVENGVDNPSGQLMHKMSGAYGIPIDVLAARAPQEKASTDAHVHAMAARADIRALYRLGTRVDFEKIEEFLRKILREKGTAEEDIEKELAELKSEFPRIRSNGRDGLFATEAKPRFLSRKRITEMAYVMLRRSGFTEATYVPPTPIELLVESEPNLVYRIDKLECDKRGDPIVLGLTGWSGRGERQIVVNSVLADSRRHSDECRFNFTLAHELFHATEHLPHVAREAVGPLARMRIFIDAQHFSPRSAAERAINHWTRASDARRLATNEDWREWQANTFASALLMPEWAVRTEFVARTGVQQLPVKTPANLREAALQIAGRTFGTEVYGQSLAELFAVSGQAMAIRLLQLNLLKEANG
jgi:transcriptional regulator with XRE-family HTH domain